jgi:recombination protein RecA
MELKDRCKEIILGSLLGDGSLRIYKPYRNARYSFRHSVKQKEYFFWKVNKLKEISSKNCVWKQKDRKFRHQSLAVESLTKLYYLTHLNGKISINRKWLNKLTPLSLAVWWLDDGSLVSDSRQGVFCTDGFDRKGILALKDYLKER